MKDPGSIPVFVTARTTATAARILIQRLGLFRAAAVLGEVARAQLRRAPFAHLARPLHQREALCRQQAGPAILLYRALGRRLGHREALALTREVAVAGAVIFLAHTIGRLDRDALMALAPAEREAFVTERGARFFNATITWDEISDEAVRFTVTHCRFPELCGAAGAPEVAPLLCQGDAVYFGEVLGTVALHRAETLADGGRCCPFELRWMDASS